MIDECRLAADKLREVISLRSTGEDIDRAKALFIGCADIDDIVEAGKSVDCDQTRSRFTFHKFASSVSCQRVVAIFSTRYRYLSTTSTARPT